MVSKKCRIKTISLYFIQLVLISSFLSYANNAIAASQTRLCAEVFVSDDLASSNYDLAKIIEQIKEIFNSSMDNTLEGCKIGASLCVKIPLKAPGIAWRIYRFKGDLKDIRQNVILELARKIQKLNQSKSDKEKREAYEELVLFWPEAILKLQKSFPQKVVKISYNAVTGLFRSDEVLQNTKASQEAATIFFKNLFIEFKNVKAPDLNFMQKIEVALDNSVKNTDIGLLQILGVDVLYQVLKKENIIIP